MRFGEYRSTTVWDITSDNSWGKFDAETAELSQPLMAGTDNSKVRGASFAGTFRHGTQPGGLILLSDTLWHRSQVFRVDPAIVIPLGSQSTTIPSIIHSSCSEPFCRINVGSKINEYWEGNTSRSNRVNSNRQQHKARAECFHLAEGPIRLVLESGMKGSLLGRTEIQLRDDVYRQRPVDGRN